MFEIVEPDAEEAVVLENSEANNGFAVAVPRVLPKTKLGGPAALLPVEIAGVVFAGSDAEEDVILANSEAIGFVGAAPMLLPKTKVGGPAELFPVVELAVVIPNGEVEAVVVANGEAIDGFVGAAPMVPPKPKLAGIVAPRVLLPVVKVAVVVPAGWDADEAVLLAKSEAIDGFAVVVPMVLPKPKLGGPALLLPVVELAVVTIVLPTGKDDVVVLANGGTNDGFAVPFLLPKPKLGG